MLCECILKIGRDSGETEVVGDGFLLEEVLLLLLDVSRMG